MKYLQGDIVIVPFPFSDQTKSKPRPAVVVSGTLSNKSDDVILAQITSNVSGNSFVYLVDKSDVETPLVFASAVRCDKLVSTHKSLIHKKISKFNKDSLDAIIEKIKTAFD